VASERGVLTATVLALYTNVRVGCGVQQCLAQFMLQPLLSRALLLLREHEYWTSAPKQVQVQAADGTVYNSRCVLLFQNEGPFVP
jgi:hypothetical protein